MANLKRWAFWVAGVTILLWAITLLSVVPVTIPNWVLILAGAAVATLLCLDWAEAYTQ